MEKKINEIIAKFRPYVQMHGGDVLLQKIENGTVVIKVTGTCAHCSLSDMTYNKMLGGMIKEEIPEIKEIIIEN